MFARVVWQGAATDEEIAEATDGSAVIQECFFGSALIGEARKIRLDPDDCQRVALPKGFLKHATHHLNLPCSGRETCGKLEILELFDQFSGTA